MTDNKNLLDDKDVQDSILEKRFNDSLKQDKFHLLLITGLFALVLTFFGYFFFVRNAIELAYWDNRVMDFPRLIEKISISDNELKTDRYLRGFKNRFIKCRFLTEDNSLEQIQSCLRWLNAYTVDGGRSKDLFNNVKKYSNTLNLESMVFYGDNPNKVKISPSINDNKVFIILEEGTLLIKTNFGERPFLATLYLEVRSIPVTGQKEALGGVNIAGLKAEKALVVYQEDYLKDEETVFNLFTGEKFIRKTVKK